MPEKKEWTLMFYLASDNALAPGVVSQLKAIKSAGFHPDANVVTQFDPFVEGTPTQVFEVNILNKLKQPGAFNVGFLGNDPFVRNLVEDKLWRDQKTRDPEQTVKNQLRKVLKQSHQLDYDSPTPPEERTDARRSSRNDPEEPDPQESLRNFLSFCRTSYPAKHFALFILGHGVVVGNDVFLYDEHASKHSISLTELGDVLREFKTDIDQSAFELVSFHSCSVSSLEVAYELKDTANYMLASQGPAFVGSWPYRSILIRIFNDLIRYGSHIPIRRMFYKIFQLSFFNAVDFLLAGYSFQLTLIDLTRVICIKKSIGQLVEALLNCLIDPDKPNQNETAQDVIQLAHLKSQSFFQEMYTDLYDFCFCITQKVEEMERRCHCSSPPMPCHCIPQSLKDLADACGEVMHQLMKEIPPHPKGNTFRRMIVAAEFLGPAFQYSRGVNVYFPWTRPVDDRRILAEYAHYKFHTDFEPEQTHVQYPASQTNQSSNSEGPKHSWLTFLRTYFDATLRKASSEECDPNRVPPGACPEPATPHCPHNPPCPPPTTPTKPNPCAPEMPAPTPQQPSQCEKDREEAELKEDIANLIYGGEPSMGAYELDKTGPKDPTGSPTADCDCPSIKNYPRDTRPRRVRTETAPPEAEVRVEFTQADFL